MDSSNEGNEFINCIRNFPDLIDSFYESPAIVLSVFRLIKFN